MAKQKMTAKQRAAREQAALEHTERMRQKQEAAEKRKKLFTIIVCVVLVIALGLPTMALAVLGGGA